jgi:hypothetical protein
MNERFGRRLGTAKNYSGIAAALGLILTLGACATVSTRADSGAERLREISQLIQDVKAFGNTVGIEPTQALARTSQDGPALSMLWLWMQRVGTVAIRKPVDIYMAMGFATASEQLKIEQIYRVNGYSVYYRQGNEFADSRSLATVGFSEEPLVRRVKVILHEDLHGDNNFALPWEIEEGVVTPLGSLAALEYFRFKNDEKNLLSARASVEQERQLSRELNELAGRAEQIFGQDSGDGGKEKVLDLLPSYPTYGRQFERQIDGQNRATVLEAKLSHDLAYYRFFDRICALAEKVTLKELIDDLRRMPKDNSPENASAYLDSVAAKYASRIPRESP